MAKKKVVKTYVKTQTDVANEMGVSLSAIRKWCQRSVPMPGKPGKYCIEEIKAWHEETFRRSPEKDQEKRGDAQESGKSSKSDQQRLLRAQADKEEALASIKKRQDRVEDGGLAHQEDVDRFISEFLSEARRLFGRLPVEASAKLPVRMRIEIKEDLEKRVNIVLNQLGDWLEKIGDLELVE